MNKIFVPHELKSIEVDTERKTFKINGEEFGRGCSGFTIWCSGRGVFDIQMEIECVVRYVHYEDNKIVSDKQGVPHSGVWQDNLQKQCEDI